MCDELDRLEREVEAAMASLSADLRVEPPEALLSRAKAAVGHELNETWLADQPGVVPSPDTMQRVRTAVHAELERSAPADRPAPGGPGPGAAPGRRRAWRWTWPALAAAAMIGICVGITHYFAALKPPKEPAVDAALNLFVDAANQVFTEDPLTAPIVADLDAVEENIARWQPAAQYDTEALGEIMEQIDALLVEPEPGEDMSRLYFSGEGVTA